MAGLIQEKTPWWLKIGVKLVLSRLHLPYYKWRKVGLFRHGRMLDPAYALGVFGRHYNLAKAYLPPGYTVLELGPGDSLAMAVIAAAHGARKVWLVDVGLFASVDIEHYRPLLQQLSTAVEDRDYSTVPEMLSAKNAVYLTHGLNSLRTIPDSSVDWVLSQAVLEHTALAEFEQTVMELFRLQKPGGVASHRIDLQDHLAHNLNSLRFSTVVWESQLFRQSGFYTNRLRASQIMGTLARAGYVTVHRRDDRWDKLPIDPRRLHGEFACFSEDDLVVRGLDVLVQKPL